MGCCEATNPNLSGVPERRDRPSPPASVDRRTALKSMAAAAGVVALSGCADRPTGPAPTIITSVSYASPALALVMLDNSVSAFSSIIPDARNAIWNPGADTHYDPLDSRSAFGRLE